MTQSKPELSNLEMARRLSVMQTTAWEIQQKLPQVKLKRASNKLIDGLDKRVEINDGYTGGARYVRGAAGKTPFVATVKSNQEGHPPSQVQPWQGLSQGLEEEQSSMFVAGQSIPLSFAGWLFNIIVDASCQPRTTKESPCYAIV